MKKFFSAARNVRLFSTFRNKSTVSTEVGKKITEGQAALNLVNELYERGELKEALILIDDIEKKYPSCSKAARLYRGEIGYKYLVKTGEIEEVANSKM